MKLSVRDMLAILVTVVILSGVFFVASLYYPTNKRAKQIARSRAILEVQVEATSPTGRQAKRENEIMETVGGNVNFFKNRNLSPTEGIPNLLAQINRMGNEAKVRFVAVKPLDEEDGPGYRHYPILIEVKSPYRELVNFVHGIESGLHLNLKDLRIENDGENGSVHRLQFTLNIFELKNDSTSGEVEFAERRVSRPAAMEVVAVHRDPFAPEKKTEVVNLPKEPEQTTPVPEKTSRPKLVLTGIVDIGESGLVIINDEVVRVGETIHGQRIEQVEDGRVIISGEDTAYTLYLDGSNPLKRIEIER